VPGTGHSLETRAIALPELREYTLGGDTFTLLGAQLSPRNTESSTLKIHLRLLNNRGYGVNLWDDGFRLVIGGIPRAPVGDLNVIVPGNAAQEGDVEFLVPHEATDLKLRIIYYGEKTDIPLILTHQAS
jgi:hypothetical protein